MHNDRRTEYFADQFGRTWEAVVDQTGAPCSGLQPFGWTAPLEHPDAPWLRGLFVPPGNLVHVKKRERGEAQRVHIDMDAWIAQQEQNHLLRQNDAVRVAKQMAPQSFMELIKNPTPAFLQEMGPSPFPPLEVLQAMVEGDAWALGKDATIPAWAEDLLQDMLYSANAMHLLRADIKRQILADQRRQRIARLGKVELPAAPDANPVGRGLRKQKLPAA